MLNRPIQRVPPKKSLYKKQHFLQETQIRPSILLWAFAFRECPLTKNILITKPDMTNNTFTYITRPTTDGSHITTAPQFRGTKTRADLEWVGRVSTLKTAGSSIINGVMWGIPHQRQTRIRALNLSNEADIFVRVVASSYWQIPQIMPSCFTSITLRAFPYCCDGRVIGLCEPKGSFIVGTATLWWQPTFYPKTTGW